MSKRGHSSLPAERRKDVRVTVRLEADVADAVFVFAGRHRTTISQLTRAYFDRLLHRDPEGMSDKASKVPAAP